MVTMLPRFQPLQTAPPRGRPRNPGTFGVWVRLAVWFALGAAAISPLSARAASAVTASLDRSVISLGESAVLSMTFEGDTPDQAPAIPSAPRLSIAYTGRSSHISIIQGRTSSTVSHNYQVTPTEPGDYVIPAMQILLNGQALVTRPLNLRVLKGSDSATGADGQGKLAFVKLVASKNTVYVGEVFPLEIQLYVTSAQDLQMPQLQGDGFVIGAIQQPTRNQVQSNNIVYNLLVFKASASAIKTGTLNLGPAQVGLVLRIPQSNRRGRDPFDSFPDPFDLLDSRFRRQPTTLVSEPQTLQVLPLPEENKPAQFNGAVGSYTMAVTVSPTNVVVGDPITLRVEIRGRGALDALALPSTQDWRDFKTYPPTAKIEGKDALGLSGVKSFEQVVIPQNAEVKELPAIKFCFFDPDQRAYQSLSHGPIPLAVRPSTAAQPQPTVLANSQPSSEEPPPRDIVHIKPQLGFVTGSRPLLVQNAWFLALQGVPVLLWLSALAWRKRQNALANDPRLRRRRQVAGTIREGLRELSVVASANKSEEFFALVFRLLQEQLGERLDLPASAITEAVLDERLHARAAADSLLSELHQLFQLCNQARYAPLQTGQELTSLLPRVQSAIRELQKLPDDHGR